MHPELILGCPGAGKTTELLRLVEEELAAGTAPDHVGFVSFTKQAATEARERAQKRFGLEAKQLPHFRTIHSFCFNALGLSSADVLEGEKLQSFGDWIGIKVSGKGSLDEGSTWGFEPGDKCLHMINTARVLRVPLRAYYDARGEDVLWAMVDRVARGLEEFKRAKHLHDFCDMLEMFVRGTWSARLDTLFVDECFTEDTPVLTGLNGEWKTIGDIVNNRYTGPVVSWSQATGTVVKRVTGHKRVMRNKRMLQIKYRQKGRGSRSGGMSLVVCTEDHHIKTMEGWAAAKDLMPGATVYIETAQKPVSKYFHKHKHTKAGLELLAQSMQGNTRGEGNPGPGREHFLKIKGGNGRGLSASEQLFLDKLTPHRHTIWPNHIIKTKESRENGYPYHYKIDMYFPDSMTCVEIDGHSHRHPDRIEQDEKKTAKLNELGYSVVRFKNEEVATMTGEELLARIYPSCLVEAEVLSVCESKCKETFVYDIEVADTHCYFAHGLLVHNCQDLSLLQWDVVEKLAQGARRVVVAGDDDQAIFAFAGAAVEHFVNMPGDVKVLGQSHRVPAAPQALALDLIGRVKGRRPKTWQPRVGATGRVRRVGNLDAVDFAAGDDTLVLARNSSFLREDAAALLRSSGIFYSWHGHPSVRRAVVDAVLDWERLRRGERIAVRAAEAVYAQMTAGQGYARGAKKLPYWQDRDAEVGMDELRAQGGLLADGIWHEALTRVTAEERTYMVRALRRGEKLTREPIVRLSTIHGSKGGQAQHVVLLTDVAYRTFKENLVDPDSELRAWYVATTRTMDTLTIVAPQTRRSYDL